MTREISGFSNPLVKAARALRDKKHRKASGQFLAEGLRIITEARDAGHIPSQLWFSPQSANHPLVLEAVTATEAAGGEALVTSTDILAKISGKDNPGAVIGIFDEQPLGLGALDRSCADIWLVAERLRDPGNLGTILRTGDAVGAGGLILIDACTDPFSVEAVRASMGAVFTQKIVQADWPDFLNWLRAGQGQLVGTSLNTDIDYQSPRYFAPAFLLIGNESQGLPEAYEKACDLLVKMPMHGKADSLNAAVACAVMAYEILNQQRRSA